MIKENIIFILELCAVGWSILSVARSKKIQQLYALIMAIGPLLCWYPLYLPPEAGATIWSGLGVWIAFKEMSPRSQKASLQILRMILITFTIVFLVKALIEMKIL